MILISYLLIFVFRALANLFERRVFPIADKIDDDLLVTKERHLKVKEDRDNLNKELEYVRDENIKLDKNYADIKKELGDHDEWLTINQKELSKLKNEKKDLEARSKEIIKDKDMLIRELQIIKKVRRHLLDFLVNQATITLQILKEEKKYDLFLSDFSLASNKNLQWFHKVGLIEHSPFSKKIKTTLLGLVLNSYLLQENFNNSQKLSITECAYNVLKEEGQFS